jgi:predicted RND superfamily exporter protein
MREKIFSSMARYHVEHPWRMIALVTVFTAIFLGLASTLKMTMRWSDLLPAGDPRTVAFNKILAEFSTASSIVVVVQGQEERIKAFAEVIVPRIIAIVDTTKNAPFEAEIKKLEKKLAKTDARELDKIDRLKQEIAIKKAQMNKRLVQRIDYKTESEFLKKYGLLIQKENDLKNFQEIYTDPNLTGFFHNLNQSMQKEYIEDKESLSTRQKEDEAVMFLDGVEALVNVLIRSCSGEQLTAEGANRLVDKMLFGESYFLSYDKSTLILNVIPSFTAMDMDYVMISTRAIQMILDETQRSFPDVHAGLTGIIPLCRDEMTYSQKSLGITSVIAFLAILVLLIISFRMITAPVIAGMNLIVGIIWASGVAAISVGQLNMMTYMFGVILLGLGIDFSIHLVSGFTEFRSQSDDRLYAMRQTFLMTGKGIVTGAVTTAIAFLALVISSSRGMKEMGLVSGLGLLAILVSTFLLLPSLLVLRDRFIEKRRKAPYAILPKYSSFHLLGKTADWLSRKYRFTLLISALLTLLLTLLALRISFDHNYMNIEPKGLRSIALQDTILEKFDLSMDYGLVVTTSIAETREIAKKFRSLGSVAMVEDITTYLPSAESQQENRPIIKSIAEKMNSTSIRYNIPLREMTALKAELDTLAMNIMEMQDLAFLGGQDKVDEKCSEIVGNPSKNQTTNLIDRLSQLIEQNPKGSQKGIEQFQRTAAPYYAKSVLTMCNAENLSLKSLPESIIDRYANDQRSIFLVTVFPSGNIWQNAEFLKRFADDLQRTSPNATGMPPVFRALIEIIGRDGRNAAGLTLILMFFVLWYDLRKPLYALMAMLPLAAGVFWMVGLMHLVGQKLTVMNVMGIPLIIGIGIDDGVHILHRWLSEGRSNIRKVFTSTGKAILLTSLTTMMGFGSLVFSIWRGFAQLGSALFIGVAACFLTTVLILPGLLGYLGYRSKEEK